MTVIGFVFWNLHRSIDEQGQEVFQYAGEVKDWTVEGERYMNIYINRVGEE